jgi:chromate transporter
MMDSAPAPRRAPDAPATEIRGSALEVARAFFLLGLTAFGGPIAHMGYFRQAFVQRRGWLDEEAFAGLLALCQFLPGPASSQMGFAIGLRRAGLAGGLAAFVGFTLPSALAMALAALGIALADGPVAHGVIAGLKVVAVAVVADAVLGMARSLCPDRFRASLALLVLAAVLVWPLTGLPLALGQVAPLILAGLAAWAMLDREPPTKPQATRPSPSLSPRGRVLAFVCLGLAVVGFLGAPSLAGGDAGRLFDALYRSGAMVFGGGHVVLPLLQAEVVGAGLVDTPTFLAGYGAAQAMPGPLFTIGAYLGAAVGQESGPLPALGLAFLGTVAVFLPGFLLLLAALPFWDRLRAHGGVRATLAGVNAGVTGLLGAALWNPMIASAIPSGLAAGLAVLGFTALRVWKLPPWVVVLALAGAGGAWL